MAWMRLEDAVRDHPKIMEAAADLSIAKVQMIGHLVLLWTWALRNAPDGDLRGRSPRHIALVCEWTGDADAFVGVLQRCRMLDGNASDGTARVHDWMEYAAQYREAQRKANTRDAQPSEDKDGSSRPGKSRTVQESPRRRRRRRETKTDPEREDRARPDATPAVDPAASDAPATEVSQRPSGAPAVAEVEREVDDAPQPRGEPFGAKAAPSPPADWGDVDEDLLDYLSEAGAREAVEIYNAHRHPSLPAWDLGALGVPAGVLYTMQTDAARERRDKSAPPWPMHRRSGWIAFAQRTHRALWLHEPGQRYSLAWWFKGARTGAVQCEGYAQRQRLAAGGPNGFDVIRRAAGSPAEPVKQKAPPTRERPKAPWEARTDGHHG